MIAKVIWNMKKTVSGMSPLMLSRPTPTRNTLSRPPIHALAEPPSPKARPVTDDEPQDRGQAADGETVLQDRQNVLGADEAAIKQRQAGKGHEQDQRRRGEQPCGVAGAEGTTSPEPRLVTAAPERRASR